ncbi:MAG: WD40 repeat domain-containing serine/threonine-protein kinase [Pseudanabaena sp. ELA607]
MTVATFMTQELLEDRYRILYPIDQGAWDSYWVEDVTHETPCVLKCFRSPAPQTSAVNATAQKFWQLAPRLQQLSDQCPSFPKILAYFQHGQEFCLVEEVITGIDLKTFLQSEQTFNESHILLLLQQLLGDLHIAHVQQVVHGDIQPANIIWSEAQQRFFLTNFALLKGISSPLAADDTYVLGAPSYMPVEQALGYFTPRCDIYALGITAIHLLTGVHPSLLVRPHHLFLVTWQQRVSLQPAMIAILEGMTQREPEERYASATMVLAQLMGLRRDSGLSVRSAPVASLLGQFGQGWQQLGTKLQLSSGTSGSNLAQFSQNKFWLVFLALAVALGMGWSQRETLQTVLSGYTKDLAVLWQPKPQESSTPSRQDFQLLRDLVGHEGWVKAVGFFPNSYSFVSGSYDRTLRLWNVADPRAFSTLSNHKGLISGIHSIGIHPSGNTFASGCVDKTIKLWNVRSGKPLQTLSGHSDQVLSVAYEPLHGEILASASADKTIRFWDWRHSKVTKILTGHKDQVTTVAFHPQGALMASGSLDKTVIIWDVNTGKPLQVLRNHTDAVNGLAFSPNGEWLATASSDRTVILWDVKTGQPLRTLVAHSDRVTAVAFSPDSQILASGGADNMIYLWSAASRDALNQSSSPQPLQKLAGHQAPVLSLSFSPRGSDLVSGSADKTLKIWQQQSPKAN